MAFFEQIDDSKYLGTEHTAGPWDPRFMHAGPPTALVGHVLTGVADELTRVADNPNGFLGRLTTEILRPVPVGVLTVTAEVEKPGKNVQLLAARVTDETGTVVLLARAWWIRVLSAPDAQLDEALGNQELPTEPAPTPGDVTPRPAGWLPGYLDAITWRTVSGSFLRPGPACVWGKPQHELVAGHTLAPIEAAWLIADSASGISAIAQPTELIFLNTELTVHLNRPPTNTEISMSAVTELQPHGVGIATSVLGDENGPIGSTKQLLFAQSHA